MNCLLYDFYSVFVNKYKYLSMELNCFLQLIIVINYKDRTVWTTKNFIGVKVVRQSITNYERPFRSHEVILSIKYFTWDKDPPDSLVW